MGPITIRYDEALVRRAGRAFWRRSLGVRFAAAIAVMPLSLFAVSMIDRDSWTVPALGALTLFVGVFVATSYVAYVQSALGRFRRMDRPESTLELRVHTFKVTSDVGSFETRWDVVTEVWRLPDFWLVLFDRAAFFILPLADVEPVVQAFILERVEAHGGKVSGRSAAPALSSPTA